MTCCCAGTATGLEDSDVELQEAAGSRRRTVLESDSEKSSAATSGGNIMLNRKRARADPVPVRARCLYIQDWTYVAICSYCHSWYASFEVIVTADAFPVSEKQLPGHL